MARSSLARNSSAKRRCTTSRFVDTTSRAAEDPAIKDEDTDEKVQEDVDDDDDDDDDSEPEDAAYDESQENFPRCPAFDPAILRIKARAESSIQKLTGVLEEYASVNEDLKNMRLKCDEVMKSKISPKRVALLGGTGAGKTSLLIALVDTPGVAKDLSAGESCTSVPMVYEHKLPDQTQKFAAKTSYYPLAKCREFLEEQLENYNRYTFMFDKYWTDSEKDEYHQAAETAALTFRTLFCNETQFESPGETTRTLNQTYSNRTHEGLLDTMTDWCAVRLRDKSQEDDTSYTFCEGSSAAELRDLLDPLITPKHACDEPSLWPLVTEVQVGVPGSKVLRHLTIHDLPGITDTNRIRVNATHDHIRKCQALWYVASVERLCTDPDLDYHTRNYARRFPGTLAVVVTKVDRDVTDALARDMREEKGQSIGEFNTFKASIKEHNSTATSIRRQLKRKTLTSPQRNELRDQLDTLEAEIGRLETQKFECIVDARNSHIVARLKREKAQYLLEGTELPVFPVSNLHYAIHKGVANREGPLLDMGSTGIPDLRSYALRLAAPEVWNDHKEILVHRVNVLFHGVLGWADNRPTPIKEDLPRMVMEVPETWSGIRKDCADRCIQRFSTEVITNLHAENASALEAAKHYCRKITEVWNPHTFLAFFRHEGKHTTQAVGSHSWNEAFLEWQINNVLKPAWETWPNPEAAFDEGVEELITALEDIPEELDLMPESVPLPIAAFRTMLKGQVALIRAERVRIASRFQQIHGNIRLDASLDQYTGFFTQAMKRCYVQGKDYRGEGVCARDQKLLSHHLDQKNPFLEATKKLEKAFKKTVNQQSRALDTEITKIIAEIDQQFELILRREGETMEEGKARLRIGQVLSELMPEIDRIEPDLEEIEQRYGRALVPTSKPVLS